MHRRILVGGAAALLATRGARANQPANPKRIALRHVNTGARFDGIWHDGTAPDPVAMAELSAVLRDAGSIQALPFSPAAIDILWQVAARTRLGPELIINSGYRTPAINRAVHGAGDSQHLRAAALDVEVPAGRMPAVAEAALRLAAGGVGVYARRRFIHLDSGPVRHWREDGVERAGPFRGTLRLDSPAQLGRSVVLPWRL